MEEGSGRTKHRLSTEENAVLFLMENNIETSQNSTSFVDYLDESSISGK